MSPRKTAPKKAPKKTAPKKTAKPAKPAKAQKAKAVKAKAPSFAFAGIDAGGSHSEVVVVDANRKVLARARGPAAALRPDNTNEVADILAAGVTQALLQAGVPKLRALVVGAAGAGRPAEAKALESALKSRKVAERLRVITDGEAALESAFGRASGVLIVAGTGSIAYARDKIGGLRRAGGLGWQLGDEGGGYALGRATLGAAGKSFDGRGVVTKLLERVYAATRTADLDALIRWAQVATREQVAALAATALDVAREGDLIAKELVEAAAHELGAHGAALVRRTAPHSPETVVLAGGLLASNTPLRASAISALKRLAPQLRPISASVDPPLGAATIALTL